jgi:hypothetical protein
MSLTVISMFTSDKKHLDFARGLEANCKDFGLRCRLYPVKYLGWMETIQQKPHCIREDLKTHNEPIIWIDVDDRILQYPFLFERWLVGDGVDVVGLNFSDAEAPIKMYFMGFNPTPRAKLFVHRWYQNYQFQPDEARAMRMAWDEFRFLKYGKVNHHDYVHHVPSKSPGKKEYFENRPKTWQSPVAANQTRKS